MIRKRKILRFSFVNNSAVHPSNTVISCHPELDSSFVVHLKDVLYDTYCYTQVYGNLWP